MIPQSGYKRWPQGPTLGDHWRKLIAPVCLFGGLIAAAIAAIPMLWNDCGGNRR